MFFWGMVGLFSLFPRYQCSSFVLQCFFLLDLCYNNRFFSGRDVTYTVISAVTLPGLLPGFVPAILGNHPGPQGLGSGPHGSVQWGDKVDEGWHHPAPCRGSLRVRPLPRRSRLGPPRLQAHRIQAQSPIRDDACGQDVCREQWWDFRSIDWIEEGWRGLGWGCNWSPDCILSSCLASETKLLVKMQKFRLSVVCRTVFILEVLIIFKQVGKTRSPSGGLRDRLLEKWINHLHHTHRVVCLQLILSQFSRQEECLLGLRASL